MKFSLSVLSLALVATLATAASAQDPQNDLLKLINKYRSEKSLGALTRHTTLDKAAQDYADLLQKTGQTGHFVPMETPNKKTCTKVEERVAIAALGQAKNDSKALFVFSYANPAAIKAGAPARFWMQGLKLGEILTYGWNTPAEALKAWQGSAPHNGNMLTPGWKQIGIGVSPRKTGGGFNWVVVFGTVNTDTATQATLDGRFETHTLDAKYHYYTNFVKMP